jgi:peroxiredoxin
MNFALGRIVMKARARPPASAVPARTVMPALRVVDHSSSQSVTIVYTDVPVPTVVYLFSPHCKFCRQNAKNMSSLVSQVAGKYRIIGVSLATDGLDEFIGETMIKFPVYTNLDPKVATAYKAGATPQTFVVGHDGRLLSMWTGEYVGTTRKSVESFFGVRFPG